MSLLAGMSHIDATRCIAAPADEVWALLTDQARWPDWSGFDSVDVLTSSPRGAMRLITSGETGVRELIRLDALARRFAYRHLEGLPVRYYAGHVTLTPTADGTTVVWRAQVEPLELRSKAIVEILRQVIQRAVDGLAETAEAQWRANGFSARCATAR